MTGRLITGILALLLVVSVLTVSCATPKPTPSPAPPPKATAAPPPKATAAPPPAAKPPAGPAGLAPSGNLAQYVTLGGSTTGTVGILGGGFVGLVRKHTKIDATYRGMAGGVPAALALAKGEVDMLVYAATQPFEIVRVQQKKSLRLISSADDPSLSIMGIFTSPKTGIKTVADLKGKRFYAENPGFLQAAAVSEGALKANGMTRNDVRWLKFDNAADAAREVIEGRADAFTFVIGAATQELADGAGEAVALPLGPKEVAAIQAMMPSLSGGMIPAKRSGIAKETPAIVDKMAFWATPAMSEKTAYTLVEALYENLTEFHAVHAQAKGFTLQNALSSFVTPFHAGVIKYYKNKGVWKAEHDELQRKAIEAEEKGIGASVPDAASFKALGILK